MSYSILLAVLEILFLFSVGFLARSLNFLDDHDVKRFSRFLINFTFPAYIAYSILAQTDTSRLHEYWILPVIGFSLMFFSGLLSYVFAWPLKDEANTKRTFRHLCAINNFGFMPIIILGRLFGDEIIPLILILNIGSTLGFWTVGVILFQKISFQSILKSFLNPVFFSLLLSLAVVAVFRENPLPAYPLVLIGKLGSITIPAMLLLTGATIRLAIFKHKKQRLLYYISLRLLVLPLLSVAALQFLSLPDDFYNVAVTVACMPAAVLSVLLAKHYDGDHYMASQAVIFSTLFSLISIPILLALFIR